MTVRGRGEAWTLESGSAACARVPAGLGGLPLASGGFGARVRGRPKGTRGDRRAAAVVLCSWEEGKRARPCSGTYGSGFETVVEEVEAVVLLDGTCVWECGEGVPGMARRAWANTRGWDIG